MYYMSKHTNKIFTEGQIRIVNDIYGKDELGNCLETGSIVGVESPSVIDFIKSNNMAGAALRYQELHNCKLKGAYDAVHAMRRDMYKISKKSNKEGK